MARFTQGFFKPKHPEKYLGDVKNIVYRSSYELSYLIKLDDDPNIVGYSSEETIIRYRSPLDGKVHRYFMDFYVESKLPDGTIEKTLVEIKPAHQVVPPVINSTKKKRTMLKEAMTYAVNQAKWQAAEAYAKARGMKFVVLTEYELGIKRRE